MAQTQSDLDLGISSVGRTEFAPADHESLGATSLRCKICQKGFAHQCSLDRHEKTCCKVVMIPCDLCDKTFSRVDNLRVHVQSKHGLGPSLNCPQCGVRFRSKIRLAEHLRFCGPEVS